MKRVRAFALMLFCINLFLCSCEKAPFITINSPRSYNFNDQGGSQSITFICNRDWRVSSTESWIHISPSSGTASEEVITVTLTCDENTTYDFRKATLTIKAEELIETIEINQETNHGLFVSPISFEVSNAAQEIEVEVKQNVQYSVIIDAACQDWISRAGTKGLVTDKLSFSIAANENYDDREGMITIQADGGLSGTIMVKQRQCDGLFASPSDFDLNNTAQTIEIEIQGNVDYTIEIDEASQSWITKSDTKALSFDKILFNIASNSPYNSREGKITVRQVDGELETSITIKQRMQYVDLGLSVLWAECNLGAINPEEYGGYYAWGEIEEKKDYCWETYKWYGGSEDRFTKYSPGVDNKNQLDPEDDVVQIRLGEGWRMPTEEEFWELVEEGRWQRAELNGIKGRRVTSRTNGDSIFLPATGLMIGTSLHGADSDEGGEFWSSSLSEYYPNSAYSFGFQVMYGSFRYYGATIRPVKERTND